MSDNPIDAGRASRGRPVRVLAIASGGGHWVQLLRLRGAFAGCDTVYASVRREYADDLDDLPGARFEVVPDATRWNRLRLIWMIVRVGWLVVRVRPDAVVSTGAAPGYVAIRFGRWLGARTVWIDSIANVERLSMSGERIAGHVDLLLTQWSHLSGESGAEFRGSVL